MQELLEKYFNDDEPFIVHSEQESSGLCYLEEIKDNHLVCFELGQDLRERIVIFNIDKIEKIVKIYQGDVDWVEDADPNPQPNYIA